MLIHLMNLQGQVQISLTRRDGEIGVGVGEDVGGLGQLVDDDHWRAPGHGGGRGLDEEGQDEAPWQQERHLERK